MTRRVILRVAIMVAAPLLIAAPRAAAQDLQQTLERVAAAWHRADAAVLAAAGAAAGIAIDIDGSSVGPLGPRQAAAVLRRVFEDRESLAVRPIMTRNIGGQPPRAFGELSWSTRARGTTVPATAKLFVAFVREGETWRITEIRLLQ